MKFPLSIFLGLILSVGASGGPLDAQDAKDYARDSINEVVSTAVEKTLQTKIEEAKDFVSSADTEMQVLLADLEKLPPDSQKYAAYFTFFNFRHDPQLIKEGYLGLSVWIHHLSNQNVIRLPQLVEGGHGTLFRVDIRDYGWDLQSWENVSAADPYFREPVINHELYSSIRLISGNILVRGDWFIDATSSPTKQIDTDQKTILYYELIYGKNIPKNRADFYKFWRADVPKIEGKDGKPSLVQQLLVEAGKSGVARHNRVLARAPTELGYLWETSDFKNSNGPRDVVNNLYPGVLVHPESDAGEFIASDFLGTQKYFVVDKAGNRLDIADAGVARDKDSEDVRVMTGRSCVLCHAGGINRGINVLEDKIMNANKLKFADYAFKLKADSAYFGKTIDITTRQKKYKIDEVMKRDAELFNQAIFDIAGISATQNAVLFKKQLNNYNKDVTLEVAAAECGVSVQEFQEKVRVSVNGYLNSMAVEGATITREQWEAQGGAYQQAMLLIKGIGKNIKQSYGEISTETALPPTQNDVNYIRTHLEADLKVGKRVLAKIPPDTSLDILKIQGDWFKVQFDKQIGYVHKDKVTVYSNEIR